MTTLEEYNQWLENYEYLLGQLQTAFRFHNRQAIEDIQTRILTTQVQIAMTALRLKKEGNSGPDSAGSPAVCGNVEISDYAPMQFNSVNLTLI